MDRHDFARQYQAVDARLWLTAAGLVGNRADADDIVQEAAVIAFRKRSQFEPGTSFVAWVARIVRFCAANHNRKMRGRRTQATDPVSLDQHASGGGPLLAQPPAASLDRLTSMPAGCDDEMLRALTQLTAPARACLLLRVVDGLGYEEIGDLLDMRPGTAMSHVHRSKQHLRRVLQAGETGRREVPSE
jgi:RNA polymerase sigma-70 factor (ECF subfamily)